MTACCEGRYEMPRVPLAALLSRFLRAACLGIVAPGAAFSARLRRSRDARDANEALRSLNDHELHEIGIAPPIWWKFDQRHGFGARPSEPERQSHR